MSMVALWILTVLTLVGAAFVVTLGNLFRAAMSLGLVLVSVAGLFIYLHADFLGFAQILVYVGAILTLVVFAVMLTARTHRDSPTPPAGTRVPAAVASALLFVLLAGVSRTIATAAGSQAPETAVTLPELGRELITTLVLPFEVISVIFVAAMVGAIAIAASMQPSDTPRA